VLAVNKMISLVTTRRPFATSSSPFRKLAEPLGFRSLFAVPISPDSATTCRREALGRHGIRERICSSALERIEG